MSADQPSPTAPKAKPMHADHYCDREDCNAWSSFGFRVAGEQRWYCAEHRADGEASVASVLRPSFRPLL
jgi:hypothetical protein